MNISVIIPVYNAEKYVQEAVASALAQPEVFEVILVEDGSSDDTLIVCAELTKSDKRVFLYRHPNGRNRRAAASRNLGIENSSGDFIAFLDADDFYLPNRFRRTREIFEQYPDIDGVYGSATHFYDSEVLEQRYKSIYNNENPRTELIGVLPEDLFDAMTGEREDHFTIDTLTVRRSLLDKIGVFDEALLQCEDTDLQLRMSLYGKLVSDDETDPVASIRIHGDNTIFNVQEAIYYRNKLMEKWIKNAINEEFGKRANRYFLRSYLSTHKLTQGKFEFPLFRLPIKVVLLINLLRKYPALAKKII